MRKNREYKSDVFSMLMESKENALEDWLKDNDKDLFSERQIQIPTPHFIVFYNGMQKRPEALQTRIESEKDLQILTSWLKAAARADSLEEFQEKTGLL